MSTDCRVWNLHQARCLLCDWSSEVTGDAGSAASDASMHRTSSEHIAKLRERRAQKRADDKP
jgi:hypothetical protein